MDLDGSSHWKGIASKYYWISLEATQYSDIWGLGGGVYTKQDHWQTQSKGVVYLT